MVRGAFSSFCHDHYFESIPGQTRMKDLMVFEAPLKFLGILVENLLEHHMRSLLERRNLCIKRVAESDGWRDFLRG